MSVRVVVASRPRSIPRCELAVVEGEEVRALPALDVEDLDVLALLHLVGAARSRASTRKSSRGSASGGGSSISAAVRGIALRTSTCRSLGGTSPSTTRPPGAPTTRIASRWARKAASAPGGETGAEQAGARRVGRRQAARVQLAEEVLAARLGDEPAQHGGGRVGRRAQRARVGRALRRRAP